MDVNRLYHTIRFRFPRAQYNKVFKVEYLPSRIRYNQFFALILASALIARNRKTLVSD